MNYSFQYGSSRGTITFDLSSAFLVGAIRDDKSNRISWYPNFKAVELFSEAPEAAKVLSTNEALQYLFYEINEITSPVAPVGFWGRLTGKAAHIETITVPVATTAFWSEGDEIFSGDTLDNFINNGGEFISEIMISATELRMYWEEHYELTSEELGLVDYLFQLKKSNKVRISKKIITDIAGVDNDADGNNACIQSLVEIGFEIES